MNKHIDLEKELLRYFNYASFRMGQKEIIQEVLNEKDVLGVLPTGSGKSVCYQLPSLLLDGITIVVSPLISLMEDQIKQLKATNFKKVIALNSFIDPHKRKSIYRNLHNYKLIYVSPELLQQKDLMKYLKGISISLFVIDEAHCISQWGHEFRPDYLKLNLVIEELGRPTILALSATATKSVQEDIAEILVRPNIVKHIYPMDRSNITLSLKEVADNQEKLEVIQAMLNKYKVPTIIYFSSRQIAEQTSNLLGTKNSELRVAYYHGGMEQTDRIAIQQQFMNNQLDVICCTSAFGMGINKNNIRLIIHYHFPPQIEAYIQEIGRAGRDGGSSMSLLLYAKSDEYIPRHMIQKELPSEEQLRSFFDVIQNHSNYKTLDLAQVAKMLELNETQWRFIHYQLEYHGMINKNIILTNQEDRWEQAYHHVNHYRRDRSIVKDGKLREMLSWMNTRGCLRENLYTKFQDSYSPPIDLCCSNCNDPFREWKPEKVEGKEKVAGDWKLKLRKLLLIGEA